MPPFRRFWPLLLLVGVGLLLFALRTLTLEPGTSGDAADKSVDAAEGPPGKGRKSPKPRGSAAGPNVASASRRPPKGLASTSSQYPANFDNEAKDAIQIAFDPEQAFSSAEDEFGVPAELLKAIAYIESRGHHDQAGGNERGGRGIMGLKATPEKPMVDRAAQILGTNARAILVDPSVNVRGAAALLKYYRANDKSVTWEKAVKAYSGEEPAAAGEYLIQVKRLLDEGLTMNEEESGPAFEIATGGSGVLLQ